MSPAEPVDAAAPESAHGRGQSAPWLVCAAIALYVVFFGWQAVLRHETFGTNAMDMGYTDQAVWNTLHGRILRFTTLENATIDLPLAEFRRTDTLLAYHVELLLVPLSLLYLIWSSPLFLLLAQVAGIALGAWPVYLLARDHLRSRWAGAAFALAFLLAPAIQGATLSDFHATSLIVGLLVWALYAAHHRRWRTFLALTAVCLLAKEDMALTVFMLGAWLWLTGQEKRVGLLSMAVALTWFGVCTLVILPHYSGQYGSPFMHRLAVFGPTLRESIANAAAQPGLVLAWLLRPEILRYLGSLLASGGWMSLFDPLTLAVALPSTAMNTFSTWSWTYSGGEHYSVAILPFVIVSAIHGTGRLANWTAGRTAVRYSHALCGLCVAVVLVSGAQYFREGVWPLSGRYTAPRVSAHDAIGHALLRQIPREASVSAQSGLYPHLSQREQAYLFPAVNEADYVILDVTGASYPVSPDGLYYAASDLLLSGDYGVVAAQDGYLLLERGSPAGASLTLPATFYTFAQGRDAASANPVSVRFGDALELVGWDTTYLNVVTTSNRPMTVTLWWRPLRELSRDYQFPLFFTRADGAIAYAYDGPTATTLWYPAHQWKPGELVRTETPVLAAGDMAELLIAVVPPSKSIWSVVDRLAVTPGDVAPKDALDSGTLYRVTRLP